MSRWFSDYILANIGAQKFAMENKNIANKMGDVNIPYLPPGSNVTVNNPAKGSTIGTLASLAVLAGGLGAGGLGLAQYSGLIGNQIKPKVEANADPVAVIPAKPERYRVLDDEGRELWRGEVPKDGRISIPVN